MKRLEEQTLYELLEVAPAATREEIRASYEKQRKLLGPGSLALYSLVSPEEQQALLLRLDEAWNVLSDAAARGAYDGSLGLAPQEPPAPAPAAPPRNSFQDALAAIQAASGPAGQGGARRVAEAAPAPLPTAQTAEAPVPLQQAAPAPAPAAPVAAAWPIAPVSDEAGDEAIALDDADLLEVVELGAAGAVLDPREIGPTGAGEGLDSHEIGAVGAVLDSREIGPTGAGEVLDPHESGAVGAVLDPDEIGLAATGEVLDPDEIGLAAEVESRVAPTVLDAAFAAPEPAPPAASVAAPDVPACAAGRALPTEPDATDRVDPVPVVAAPAIEEPAGARSPDEVPARLKAATAPGEADPVEAIRAAAADFESALATARASDGPAAGASEPALPLPAIGPQTVYDGDLLRRVRLARGLDLNAIARRTRINAGHLANVEADRFADLPERVFLRGILTAYARELRLDPTKVCASYLERWESNRRR